MMWINYTCQIVFFGAEFTKVYAREMGHSIKLSSHAKWIAAKKVRETEEEKEN